MYRKFIFCCIIAFCSAATIVDKTEIVNTNNVTTPSIIARNSTLISVNVNVSSNDFNNKEFTTSTEKEIVKETSNSQTTPVNLLNTTLENPDVKSTTPTIINSSSSTSKKDDTPLDGGSLGGDQSILPGWFSPDESKRQLVIIKDTEKEDRILPEDYKSSFAISSKDHIDLQLKRIDNISPFTNVLDDDEMRKRFEEIYPSNKNISRSSDDKTKQIGIYQDVNNRASILISGEKRGGFTIRRMEGKFVLGTQKFKLKNVEKKDFPNELNSFPTENDPVKDGVPHLIEPFIDDSSTSEGSLDGNVLNGDDNSVLDSDQNVIIKPKVDYPPIGSDINNPVPNVYPYSSCKDYHIEVLSVVSNDLYKYYYDIATLAGQPNSYDDIKSKIQIHLATVFNDADVVYKNVHARRWGICLTLWLSNIKFLFSSAEEEYIYKDAYLLKSANYEENVIDAEKILENLGKWKEFMSYGWYNLDAIVLFTKHNLARKDTSKTSGYNDQTVGAARSDGACRYGVEGGIAVVEDIGGATWWPLAHEVGHLIGAKHDGEGSAIGCAPNRMNIMTPNMLTMTPTQYEMAYEFSDCSVRDISALLSGQKDNYPRICLTNRVCMLLNKQEVGSLNNEPDKSVLSDVRYRNLSLDFQCKNKFTTKHSECTSSQKPWATDICQQLYCTMPDDGSSSTKCMVSSPGANDMTPCGLFGEKWCFHGKCIEKTLTPSKQEVQNCRMVSIPITSSCQNIGGNNCWVDVIKNPDKCFQNDFKKNCCNSCETYGLIDGSWYNRQLQPNEYPVESVSTCKDLDDDCPNIIKKYTCLMDIAKQSCPFTCGICTIATTIGPSALTMCDPNPCMNNGICSTGAGGIRDCDCPRGFDGRFCERALSNNDCVDTAIYCKHEDRDLICSDPVKKGQCHYTCRTCTADLKSSPVITNNCIDLVLNIGGKPFDCSKLRRQDCNSNQYGTAFRNICCKTCERLAGRYFIWYDKVNEI